MPSKEKVKALEKFEKVKFIHFLILRSFDWVMALLFIFHLLCIFYLVLKSQNDHNFFEWPPNKKTKSFYFFIFKSLKNKVFLLLDFEVIWLSCGTYDCFTFLVLSNQAPFRGTLLDLWSFYEKWNKLKYHNSVKWPQNKKVKVFNFFQIFKI